METLVFEFFLVGLPGLGIRRGGTPCLKNNMTNGITRL